MKKNLLMARLIAVYFLLLLVIKNEIMVFANDIPVPVVNVQVVSKPVISWNDCGNEYTYKVYRMSAQDEDYECIANDVSECSFRDGSAISGQSYWYCVQAAYVNSDNEMCGNLSNCVHAYNIKDDPQLKYVKSGLYGKLKWTKWCSRKYQYVVYRATSYKGKYKKVLVTEKNTYKLTESDSKEIYYYKVKAYRCSGNKKMYSEYSNVALSQPIVDLVIFMGQSNMAGRGDDLSIVPEIEKNTAYEFKAITNPNKLCQLKEPFGKYENVVGAINDVDSSNKEQKTGGMVAALSKQYFELTGVPIVGVSASITGTGIKYFQPCQPILNDAINRLETAKEWLYSNEYNVRHIYMVWDQGENDVNTSQETYIKRAEKMIKEMRKHGVEMCFVVGTGEPMEYPGIYTNIRNAQIELCAQYKYAYMTTLIASKFVDKGLMSSGPHYNQAGYNLLGTKVGNSMGKYVNSLQ